MEPLRDPEEQEIKHLQEMGNVAGTKVLEIGCGNGRMTWRYANQASSVIAIDPDLARLTTAIADQPAEMVGHVHLVQANVAGIPFAEEQFDTAIFAWSL